MPVVRNDPCGWTCLLMTYAAVIYADYVIIKWVVLQTMSESAWGVGKQGLHCFWSNIAFPPYGGIP